MLKDVFKDKKLLSLYLFYISYFFAIGMTTYSGKFYGEIGLSNSQISLISAIPAFIALFVQPVWGTFSDRAKYKRNVLTLALVCAALCAFMVQPVVAWYIPLLLVLTLINTFTLPILPVGNAIAIEYTKETGHDFGPVRMMGTVGYQVIILLAGFFFATSLNGLYTAYGAMLLVAAASTLLLPPVQGHQHGKEKLSFTVFFKDKSLLLLFCLVFLAQMCSQFYLAFFSKHLGDLGINNATTGIITTLCVILEIPFLFFGDKLMKKMSIWKWMWIGLIINAIRFLGLSVAKTPVPIVAFGILSVGLMACFEFFPAIHLNKAVAKELRGTVQNTYTMIAFGASRIIGALIGGFIADATSIATVFGINGSMLAITAIVMTVPLLKRAKADTLRD